jgi:RecA DNA recombination protein
MRAAISKAEIESEITSRFGSAFRSHEKRPAEVISTGIPQIDSFALGGLPRGSITEVFGPASSGRTSFMLSALVHATKHEEVCALVDTNNGFDPKSAAQAEMNFQRLLWIRCANNLEHAFKATDLLLQGGGFGLVMLDLGDVPAKSARRIISSWWYRFRRTLEATPTVLVIIAEESCVRSCAALALELRGKACLWSSGESPSVAGAELSPGNTFAKKKTVSRRTLSSISTSPWKVLHRQTSHVSPPHSNLLKGLSFQVQCQRPLYLLRTSDEVLVEADSWY